MHRIYKYVFPEVRSELKRWRETAELMPDPELRKQAVDSLTHKEFHCKGGAVYAAANLPIRHVLIPLIVAFQTISDYLDNLCDRSTSLDPEDFRLLHRSMLDAVDPAAPLADYYALRAEKDDGGYLHELVRTCQSCVSRLPSYPLVRESVRELVGLYGDLQVYKHIRKELRERELLNWWEKHRPKFSHLRWNEFAAATGSTLAVFHLFLAASDTRLTARGVETIRQAYFPHVCGLHILLDYLIDQEEDLAGGDLNFCGYYEDGETTARQIADIAERARRDIVRLDHPRFHRMIIEGLLALYLSDPKVREQKHVRQISRKLMKGSPLMRVFFFANSIWIRRSSF
ncbi:tetraprenyl-beta-curcumene synthase family protein [Paenibacillus hemerocallicola]|uniref:Tetraprenyl-beta-curcumene synthase family protein n=1 Tax=Paenibacillus hemerocallicola TaxID=1172614 RepID=A0A5C4TAZ4_9BACL|nr:tetraprenyl-beta-curcumene synthase family protein [Paenibacillus hemerocallicola]TNJ65780.1 tetraprenyl-beta-curcumene synthase family protein [Paenibacillus hemerocallicola]